MNFSVRYEPSQTTSKMLALLAGASAAFGVDIHKSYWYVQWVDIPADGFAKVALAKPYRSASE